MMRSTPIYLCRSKTSFWNTVNKLVRPTVEPMKLRNAFHDLLTTKYFLSFSSNHKASVSEQLEKNKKCLFFTIPMVICLACTKCRPHTGVWSVAKGLNKHTISYCKASSTMQPCVCLLHYAYTNNGIF